MKPVVIIVSDLHMGGGPDDELEDHVAGEPFARLVDELRDSDEGRRGDIDLIINGDFLEFCQVAPEVFDPIAPHIWCSLDQSKAKLEVILKGHPRVFEALGRFQEAGTGGSRNRVTIAAGNHDVDLYWPEVQQRLRQLAGPVEFELRSTWYERFGGRLQISHGHHFDPANSFKNWDEPFVFEAGTRLEMCPGTLFVVAFINEFEKRFRFADNVKPYRRLVQILWREARGELGALAWLFAQFATEYPGALLSTEGAQDSLSSFPLADRIQIDDGYAGELLAAVHRYRNSQDTLETLRQALPDNAAVRQLLTDLLLAGGPEALPAFPAAGAVLSVDDPTGGTLGIAWSARSGGREPLRQVARRRALEVDAQVVVIGHTHLPDEVSEAGFTYYNTGSWTPYLEIGDDDSLTLDDLNDSGKFPYRLYYVRVQEGADGKLRHERVLFT